MAVRVSMADLIARVRTLIADPVGTGQTFDNQVIQDALDRYQTVVRYARLRPEAAYLPDASYLDYYADVGDWEADEKLYDSGYNLLTPSTADRLVGHWTFAASQPPPVFIVGKVYDVYGAAADLLEVWAAKEKLSFDFDTDGQSFKRSQKVQALLDLARTYRRQQPVRSIPAVRQDIQEA